jgi:hypothetical protein
VNYIDQVAAEIEQAIPLAKRLIASAQPLYRRFRQ